MRYIKYRQSLEDVFFKHPPPSLTSLTYGIIYLYSVLLALFSFKDQLFIDSMQINKPKTLLFK